MKKNRKIILCISLICVFILLAAFSYWFFFYPYRVLGVESDSRYYSNHVVSKLTGREESTAVFDTFVTFYPDGKICILKMKDGYGYQFLERDPQ
ncbi:MAG: hypothetical protein IJU80_00075 [Lachnospiraceae bacterium]|nr:hypothetical protein [Lachnospiraceae bacterium]